MARPGGVPITRLRFRGRRQTLLKLCQVFREHPHQGLTANEIAEFSGLPYREVHERLSETPELFVRLPKRPDTNTRYRFASALASQSADEVAFFVDEATRAETRLVAMVLGALLAIVVVAAYLSLTR